MYNREAKEVVKTGRALRKNWKPIPGERREFTVFQFGVIAEKARIFAFFTPEREYLRDNAEHND